MSIPKDAPEGTSIVDQVAAEPLKSDDGSFQVAGLGSAITRQITKGVMKPLTKPGARVDPDVQVGPATRTETPEAEPVEPVVETPAEPQPEQPEVEPTIEPVSEEAAAAAVTAREEGMDAPRTAPDPSKPQKEAGVVQGRVNTTFYDSDQLNATIQAVSADLPELQSRTIQSLYDDAAERGIATNILDQIFKGKPMTSNVGNDELATRMAALVTIHDASLVRVDDLMAKAASGTLDQNGKVVLREALAQHNIILEQLTTAKTDIARSMNAFRGAGDGTVKTLSVQQRQAVLDQFGGDDQLRVLAEKWMTAPDTKAKNKLVEVGIFRKTVDAIIYTAQSSLLTDPNTHLFNAAGTTGLLALDMVERTAAAGVGVLRDRVRRITGRGPTDDRILGRDISARASGIFNGVLDGWRMMADGFMQREVQAKDVPRMALGSEYFSNTPMMTLRGQVYRTGELKGTVIGTLLDGMGLVHSVPMRFIAAADGFFGGVSQRMALHEQAQRIGLDTYFNAIDAGKTPEEAMSLAQEATGKLLTEQPANVAANVDDYRRMITLQADIDRETVASPLYTGSSKLLNSRPVKAITLFNKTLMNIANQGTARMPVMNLISPQFWSDWKKGGGSRDLAMTRVALGTGMLMGGYQLSEMGRFTAAGPIDPADRDTLTSMGYMPFALRLGPEETLSAPTIERLEEILGEGSVSKGIGEFEGQTFISLKKLEPATMPLMMGAAIAQGLHYSDYDEGELQAMVSAGAGAMYQTASNFPQTQLLSELYRIMASQQLSEDDNDKLVRAIDALVGTYSNTLISGTPIVGLANGALSARFERYMDPSISETGIRAEQAEWADEVMGIDMTAPGFRAFGEAYNRLLSRTPFMSDKLPVKLNEFGEPLAPDLDTLYNFGPRMKAGMGSWSGKNGELKMYLAEINHGITRLPKNVTFNGVTLNAEQRVRFIQLYANEIRIDGMTMVEAILEDANELVGDIELLGMEFPFGEAQQRVNSIVSEYRSAARARMFGKFEVDKENRVVNVTNQGTGKEYGLPGDLIEYPESSEKMRMERVKRIFEPK